MSSTESKAKRLKVLDTLEGYHSLIGKDLTGLTNALVRAADPYPFDTVLEACKRLAQVCKFPPTPADMTEWCEHFNAAMHPKVVELYNGLISMDFGHGSVDMKGLTKKEQDVIILNNGMIGGTMDRGHLVGGKNAALMDLETKRAALRALPAPESDKTVPMPKLQRI
jgi:hypothetical protein